MIRRLFLFCLCLLLLSACSVSCPVESPPVEVQNAPVVTPGPNDPPLSPADSLPGTEPSLPPEPSVEPYDYSLPAPEREEVDMDWFADAVFVGDSRTDGLRLYGGIEGADFICYKGLISREFSTKTCISLGGEKVTPQAALEQKRYGKVYVMLGLNELGFAVEAFAEDYAALLDALRQAQPEAAIYVQPVVPINTQKAKEKDQPYYVTNEKIAQFNAEIVRLAQEKRMIFVNVAEGLTDGSGELPYDSATDGIHFTRAWYQVWSSYLKTHTVDPERLEAAQ